jgi:hypothetical protein
MRSKDGSYHSRLHVGDGLVGRVTVIFPAWSLEGDEASVGVLIVSALWLLDTRGTHIDHSHPSLLVLGDDPESLFIDNAFGSSANVVGFGLVILDVGVEQVTRVVRFEPFTKQLKLAIISRSLR